MRRTRFILALVTVATAVMAGAGLSPVSAHFCAIPADIDVGKQVMVNIGVAAEEEAVREVDIEIPDGFELKEPVGFMGYEPTRVGDTVHFEGAEIEPYTCHYFAFSGEATRKGRLVARIVTTTADGTKTTYDDLKPGALYPAMLIYAGVTPEDFAEKSSGWGIWVAVGIAVAAAVAVAILVLVRRRVTMGR